MDKARLTEIAERLRIYFGSQCTINEYTAIAESLMSLAAPIIREEAIKQERERIEKMLDLCEDEMGFVSISNHVHYSDWLKKGE